MLADRTIEAVSIATPDFLHREACVAAAVLASMGVKTPDLYTAIVKFRNGGIATLESTWILPNTMPGVGWGEWIGLGIAFEMQIVGSGGAYFVRPLPNQAVQKYTDSGYSWPDTFATYFVDGKWGGFAIEAINHFVDCVAEDRKPSVTGEDGLAVTKVICAMEKSAETGRPESL